MSPLPLPLFEDGSADPGGEAPRAARTLVIHPTAGRPLDKKQRAFNRLLAKVESLRARLEDRKRQLDRAAVFHAAEIAPRVREELGLRKEAIRALRPFLQDRRLRGGDRRLLAGFLVRQVDFLFQQEHVQDPDLHELFQELHGISVAEVAQSEIDLLRGEMAELFGSFGVDVEIPELRPGMTDEDMAASAASFIDQMQRELEDAAGRESAPGRPKSKHELREEAKARRIEEARRNSIGVVYKRLARALHPDLEPDPAARERKGTLMQQVTAAHAANDLHTLLRLEIELIHDAADAASLTAERLGAYTEMLKQQAADLEAEIMELLYHPRYADVVAAGPMGPYGVIDVAAEAQRLDAVLEGLRVAVAKLREPDPFAEVQALVAIERSMMADDYAGPGPHRPRKRRRRSKRR